MSKFANIIIGGLEIIGGVILEFIPGGQALGGYLIAAGAGQVIAGIGTLLNQPQQGLATAARNPVMPWNVIYGRAKTGGTIVYVNETGEDNKYLDLVLVLASHPCEAVDALLFDNQRVLIDPATRSSFTPTQHTTNIASIVRTNGVVTVTLSAGIGDLQDGDQVQVQNVSGQAANDRSLNGRYYVEVIDATHLTYLCGGFDVSLGATGQVQTLWPDYRSKVYMEVLLGNQTSTFQGMLTSTPYDGDPTNPVTVSNNPWTSAHMLNGKTAVMLRLHYNDEVFAAGLPQISFRVRGKNDIYDPRSGDILGRPSTTLNGWGPNGHVGAYEEGEDLGFNWGLDGGTTRGYQSPDKAVDGNLGTAAVAIFRHTHEYAGCVWTFGAITGAARLNILSEVPSSGPGTVRSAGIWYSLDGGSTWVQLYNAATRAKQWDSITLPGGQDTTQIQVMAFTDSHDDMTHAVYDIHLGTGPATSGYTENAALCIADYLSNPTWGFRASYGTEIPAAPLIAAANICDEAVTLASGATEPRYTCNGQFQLTTKRSEILQNMLTSCGGRLTYSGGQFIIHPAAWPGSSLGIGSKTITSATLSVITDFAQGAGYTIASANVWIGNISILDSPAVSHSTDYAKETDTHSLSDGALASLNAGTMHVQFDIEPYPIDPFGDASPGAQFRVYDAWIDVVYEDASTATLRATTTTVIPSVIGSVTAPGNAIDGDPNSAATIERHHFSPLGSPPILQLGNFRVVATTPGPDTSSTGVAASRDFLTLTTGPFRWRPKVAIRDLYNGVKGTFISPSNGWQNSDFPPYAQDGLHGYTGDPSFENDANLASDGGDRRWLEIQLPFTISYSTAQRLAKIELLRRRQQGSGTFSFDMTLYQCTALDVLTLTLPVIGWYGKLLEIAKHRLTITRQGEATLLGCELDLVETDPSVYEWSASEELTPQGFQQSGLPNTSQPAAPTSVTAASGPTTSIVGADGIARSRILVTWTAPADGYVLSGGHIEVQYEQSGTTAWIGLPSVDPSVTKIYVDSVTDGDAYLIQVRSVNAAGVPSAWVQAGPVTVSGTSSSIAPGAISQDGATTGQVMTWNGTAWVPTTAVNPPLIAFNIGNGSVATKVGGNAIAPRTGPVAKCKIVIDASDPAVPLTFTIKKNGVSIFSSNPTVAAATAADTLITNTSLTSVPLAIAADDLISLDITSGSPSWQFTAQLES